MPQSKRMTQRSRSSTATAPIALRDAVELLKGTPSAKFDESVDLAVNLGVDPKHADQMVRGALVLPHGTGKTVRVAGLREGREGEGSAGRGRRLTSAPTTSRKKIQEGWLDFDRVIATPDMMGVVGKLGRVLGPRGLMPNPKVGTVTMDVGRAVTERRPARSSTASRRPASCTSRSGKKSFSAEQLVDNATRVDRRARARQAGCRRRAIYLKKITISTTMGPGVRVDPTSVETTKVA